MSGTEGLARMDLNDPTFVVAVTDLQLNNIGLIERVVALCRKKGYRGSPYKPARPTEVGTFRQQLAIAQIYTEIPHALRRQDERLCSEIVRSCVLRSPQTQKQRGRR